MFGIIRKTAQALTLAGTLALLSTGAQAASATFASTGAETSIPYGWLDFCARYAGECPDDMLAPRPIEFSPQAMRQIRAVNAYVNRTVEPVSDMDHWGVIDQWDYPTDSKGDCEDYALMKRRMLMKAGFPRQALLMTVVKEKNGDGHAVLMVKTTHGDFVLDNLSEEVRLWNETPYRFVKRQSEENPSIWVSIGAPTNAPDYVSK
ncbi:MAG TPA: transglutaminase-like cysteine peptidase [Methylocystis sp.]|nr:transglutaminase-like cysteine peptidase [Methylocystis sp.]